MDWNVQLMGSLFHVDQAATADACVDGDAAAAGEDVLAFAQEAHAFDGIGVIDVDGAGARAIDSAAEFGNLDGGVRPAPVVPIHRIRPVSRSRAGPCTVTRRGLRDCQKMPGAAESGFNAGEFLVRSR